MAAVAEKLTLIDFQSRYERSERSYEFWLGEAVPKAMPTWILGLLQAIVARLLTEAGYRAGVEVELRIDSDAHPKPDVIATSSKVDQPYPNKAVDVVVEILSEDDPMQYVLGKCQAYKASGFEYIYVVNSESEQVFRGTGAALELATHLTSIPVTTIWEELQKSLLRP